MSNQAVSEAAADSSSARCWGNRWVAPSTMARVLGGGHALERRGNRIPGAVLVVRGLDDGLGLGARVERTSSRTC